ncbi:unnamed protein product [Schistosoma rodhaini]|uniref:mitogen-activated protein kinase kinase kinase n=1 Tax=Schistosoma rodhaini TaxID=6188 RepID=A0AA85EP14_9TREM|nr:unnamed protein product [Schistosoma rodhaini]CAH8681394.1 unnamed protein product [Schistosoma rodhaini]
MYITMVEDKPISYQESATENHNTLASSKMDSIFSGKHCEASSEYVTAIYSYMPQHSDEINLRTGQKIKILSKDCRHSGAEGWWVGQEPKTGHVGVFPSGYVLNPDDITSSESPGANEMKANSFEQNIWNDVTFGIGNNTDKIIAAKTKEEMSLDKSPDSEVILRHGHVRTIPATELVQQQFIGSGAFGKVYRGLWREQDIALKVFDLATNQVDNEALHLCRLSHRNIVRFYGICRLDKSNSPALVMEYAYGGSLNMVLNQRPLLGPLVLLDWALQIASGMAYLHTDARICHRDLKSSNILIREAVQKPFSLNELQRCTLLITDFGMACRSSQLAPQQSKLGTVAYAAPEVCRQEGFSFKSDIWSYGVVLWELLTLDIPFRAMEQPRLLFIIAMYNYTLYVPPGIPDLFVQLLKDCWSPTPDSRPKFENIMARLKSCKDCSFVDLEPSELAQIQQDWRELIAVHYKEEQQTVAEALSSSFRSGSLDFSTELLTQLEMLRDYRESLDRVRADLVEKAHQLHIKEELYNRVADTMGQHFMFLAVLAANHFKDPTHKIQAAQPKPPPPRKRPFVRSIFKRWGTNGNPCSTHNDYVNSAYSSTNNFQLKDRKRSINYSQCTSNNRPHLNVNTNNSSDLNNSFCDETQSISRDTSSRVGCSQGGIPLISPPTDMKHVVHVDSDWFTGQGLCESTMRLFPSAKFTSSSVGSNNDKYRNMSSGHCYSPQIRTFANTKSDSNMTDKSHPKSPRIYSSGNNITDLRLREQRFVDVQTSSQRNLNRLARKQNFIRKFENKNNLDFLQKSSNHSVGFSNFFTPINSCCYDTNNDLHHSEHSGYHHCRVIQPIIGTDNRIRNNSSPPFFERRRSASGPVTFFTRYPKTNDQLKSNADESLFDRKLNELLCMICDHSMLLPTSGCTQHFSGRSLSTTTPPTACFSSDITESSYFLKPTRNSTVENVLLSAFRLLASFCFWGVEPDIDDEKANSLIPLYSTPRSFHNFGKISYPVAYCTSQSSQSYNKQKNAVRNATNSSLLFGQNESDFQHVLSSNSVCPIGKRKYKFSIQNTRRIQSADRRRNYKYNTSLKCPVCVNMGLDSVHPYEKFPDHQVEFGDPHSPFLGMLAGSGRRPNPSPNMKEINHSNFSIIPSHEMISSDKRENYFIHQHNEFLKDIKQKIGEQQQCKHTKLSDNNNNNSYQYTHCNLCNDNQMEIVAKNESTGKLNNAFHCPHLSVYIDYCQNGTRNKDIDVATIKTTLPYIPSSSHLAQRWSFEHSKELHKDICSSFCSFLSCRRLSIDCQSSMISDCLRSVDKHSISESVGPSIERNSTSQFSHSLVSMNPVGMSRDAYLKATQDGFLNRTIYEPSEDPKFYYSSYSNQTSQSDSLQRSNDNQSFSKSDVYPNIHALFIENSKSESGSEFESYDDANKSDYPNFILNSSSPPKHSQRPQNFYSPSKIHLSDSDKPPENNDYSYNLNVNIHTCRDDDDRVTLVPIQSEELSNVIQPYSDNAGKEETLAECYNGNSTSEMAVKRVLHRSQAMRERHRPAFLNLFRNRSLPSCVDSDCSCLESCSFLLCPSDNSVDEVSEFPHQAESSKSPSSPFVSLHSTFI